MVIQFRKSIATARGGFMQGQNVRVSKLPKGWADWLTQGVIRILPEDQTEIAVEPERGEQAVVRPRRAPAYRRNDRVRGDRAKPDA